MPGDDFLFLREETTWRISSKRKGLSNIWQEYSRSRSRLEGGSLWRQDGGEMVLIKFWISLETPKLAVSGALQTLRNLFLNLLIIFHNAEMLVKEVMNSLKALHPFRLDCRRVFLVEASCFFKKR